MKQIVQIKKVSKENYYKNLHTSNGRILKVPLSVCVGKGDSILLNSRNAWIQCKNGLCQFLPSYSWKEKIKLGSIVINSVIKEITSEEEFSLYKLLTEHHYRGKQLYGRTARLIVRSQDPLTPRILGFIELATPFYMNKARTSVFDINFKMNGIKWNNWNQTSMKKNIHVFVRIARIVIYPEYRGIGLGQLMIKHAARYAKLKWQVSGYKPLFIEISADMLKYIPVAEQAGMTFVGETEGNLTRIGRDMKYLINRFAKDKEGLNEFEGSFGICDIQASRMTKSLSIMKDNKISKTELLKRLSSIKEKSTLSDYSLFHKVLSYPKPHYMLGLNYRTKKFIQKRATMLSIKNGKVSPILNVKPIHDSIIINKLDISFSSKVRITRSTQIVQRAFEIFPEELNHVVIKNFDLEVLPGEIVLIIGPSGSGKTSLLNAIEKYKKPTFKNSLKLPKNAKIGSFEEIKTSKPLIEIFCNKDVNYVLYLLSLAGISEPYLYLKQFKYLSAGQKYRAMLAYLLSKDSNIWLADEFCANLDQVTANVVSHNIQKIARKAKATVIAAAPHSNYFIESLKPDKVIILSTALDYRIISGPKYISLLKKSFKNDRP